MLSRIAIVGAGALGCYYGARLVLAGNDVRFLLRRDLAAVRERGLTLHENDETRRVADVAAFGTTAEIGPVDVVIITLKTTANASLPSLLAPLLHADTTVLTLQNGLGNEELVAGLVGAERVLGGLCYIGVTRDAPGELRGYHTPGAITLGEFGRPAGARTRALAERLAEAGMKLRVVDDLAEARWQKLVWNVPFNGLSIARGGITTDKLLGDPATATEVRALMDEIAVAGRALGFDVSEKFIQAMIDVTLPIGPYAPSSLVDFLGGREVEVEAIWGEPLRRAQRAGVAMPRLAQLHRALVRLCVR